MFLIFLLLTGCINKNSSLIQENNNFSIIKEKNVLLNYPIIKKINWYFIFNKLINKMLKNIILSQKEIILIDYIKNDTNIDVNLEKIYFIIQNLLKKYKILSLKTVNMFHINLNSIAISKNIANKLKIKYLLKIKIFKEYKLLMVTISLISIKNGEILWSSDIH